MLTDLCRVGRDAELRYTQDGKPVCNVSLAYDVGFGENRTTQWVSASIWGKRAEALAPKLTKGALVHVVLDNVASRAYMSRGNSEPRAEITGRIVDVKFASKPEPSSQPDPREPQERAQQAAPPQQDSFPDDDIPF